MAHTPTELVISLDEAGRGPLAGPVSVGAVMTLRKIATTHFHDSKQLTSTQRETCFAQLKDHAQRHDIIMAVGMRSAHIIDTLGIIKALHDASCEAIRCLLKQYFVTIRYEKLRASRHGEDIIASAQLNTLFKGRCSPKNLCAILACKQSVIKITGLLLDGNHTFGLEKLGVRVQTIIKGDQKVPTISMASILAKVTRDHYMAHIAKHFPHYDFSTHKGYGTLAHRRAIKKRGVSTQHRVSFCQSITHKLAKEQRKVRVSQAYAFVTSVCTPSTNKPKLLLHICCAPDLSRPLHWLKQHFHLVLFRYNPNIHPRQEHTKRYEQFLKLVGLEKGEYDILEDRYDPKEFFDAMVSKKEEIHHTLLHATGKEVLKLAGEMEERSDRCNPCYSMRLEMAAKMASQEHIPYFTSTLLISPKKKMDKLMRRGCEAEKTYAGTKFLRFDFQKNGGYIKAVELTRTHGLRRQNYCGCGRTIPKPGEDRSGYTGG